jgi:HAMP domain-containing protein
MRLRWARGGTPSLRTRLLAGVMIPSTLVLVVGGVVGVRLVTDAVAVDRLSDANSAETELSSSFFPSLVAERAASLFYLAQPTLPNRSALDQARQSVDTDLQPLVDAVARIDDLLPPGARGDDKLVGLLNGLPELRTRVDARTVPRLEAYEGFNELTDWLVVSNNQRAGYAPSGPSAGRINRSGDLDRVADLVDRSTAILASGLLAGDMSREEFDEFVVTSGAHEAGVAVLTPQLDADQQQQIAAIQASPEWQQVILFWDSVIFNGYSDNISSSVPAPQLADVVRAGRTLATRLLVMGSANTKNDSQVNAAQAQDTLRTAILTAVLLLAGLALAFTVALMVTARLVNRLSALRRETLDMASTALPLTIDRVRRGERVDLDQEMPTLDHGRDEIGQVASAFNKAQRFAVESAVEESQTREGFNAAFLNIARRSQAILHQQMQVLDRIERSEPDPDRLELLFSLDHLATRERRNAENLIILGGEQPRRQWRNPVALGELVRAAVGESEHYQRVTVARLPHVMVDGGAVGDLVHLLAELVDNATAFSPPAAPIEVHGTVVGRGVVVEVEDQGLGMDDDQLAQANALLADPPDFGLFTLSRDSRIGLFVVARLARRHQVKVSLRASAFGGVRAGLLIPTTALAGGTPPPESSWQLPAAADSGAHRSPVRVGAAVGAANGRGAHDQPAPDDHYADGHYADAPVRVPARLDHQNPHALERAPVRRAVAARSPEPRPDGPVEASAGSDRPRLPRRTRQTHMDSRLLDRSAPAAPPPPDTDGDLFAPPDYSPETARSRMTALRRGAARARIEDVEPGDGSDGGPSDSTSDSTGRTRW